MIKSTFYKIYVGSIPDVTIALGSTQPLTEFSTKNLPGGYRVAHTAP
jgi:hypothetical protein